MIDFMLSNLSGPSMKYLSLFMKRKILILYFNRLLARGFTNPI